MDDGNPVEEQLLSVKPLLNKRLRYYCDTHKRRWSGSVIIIRTYALCNSGRGKSLVLTLLPPLLSMQSSPSFEGLPRWLNQTRPFLPPPLTSDPALTDQPSFQICNKGVKLVFHEKSSRHEAPVHYRNEFVFSNLGGNRWLLKAHSYLESTSKLSWYFDFLLLFIHWPWLVILRSLPDSNSYKQLVPYTFLNV